MLFLEFDDELKLVVCSSRGSVIFYKVEPDSLIESEPNFMS